MGSKKKLDIDPFFLADAIEAGVIVHDRDTEVLYANSKVLELLNVSNADVIGRTAEDVYKPFVDAQSEPIPLAACPAHCVLSTNQPVRDLRVGIVRPDQSRTTWATINAYPEFDENKELSRIVVTFLDVTDRVREERLREAQVDIASRAGELDEEALLQLVLRWCEAITNSQVSFLHLVNDDQETIELIAWSERTLDEFCNVVSLNRHYPISEAGIWAEGLRTQEPVVVNDYDAAKFKRGLPEGHAQLDRFISMPVLDGDKVRVLLGVGNKAGNYTNEDVRDLTFLTNQIWRTVGQKRSDTRARKLVQAVEQTPATILMTDTDGVIRYINPAFTQITGYDSTDVEGRRPNILKSGEMDESIYDELWWTITTGGTWTNRLRNRKKDGTLFWSNVVISPLQNEQEETIGYLGIGEDITEQVELEDKLHHAQKMDVIGQLTGGVAHDFNNYLAIISGNLQLLEEEIAAIDGAEDARVLISDALWSAERGADLTNELLAFARQQTLFPNRTDINQVAEGMVQLLKHTLGENIAIVTNLKTGLRDAMVDGNQLETALLNLAVNGRDAMPDGGVLRILTDNVELHLEDLDSESEINPGHYVAITVSDTGVGMSRETCARVFEPFFTTKRFGSGSGLGLSMVYGFVRQTGGHIAVESTLGLGTSVTLYLPQATGETPRESDVERCAPQRARGNEVILVVENDDRVRRTAANTLRKQGYSVIESSCASEALDTIERNPHVDLIFSDIVLPEAMDGRELVNAALERRPRIRVLLTSAYIQYSADEHGLLDGHRFITKPYARGELANTVREVLDNPIRVTSATT